MPDWNKEFIIELDGSKVAIGGTLKQASDQGEPRILSYHSSTLEKSQRNYSPTELECWAGISCCRKFDVYIKGAPSLLLISDHEPLQWLRQQKDPRGKFGRWIMELEQYDYRFQYRPGVDHVAPDALSRIETGDRAITDDESNFEDHIYVVEIKDLKEPKDLKDLIASEQDRDVGISIAKEQLLKDGCVTKGRFKNFKLFIQNGLVVKSGRILLPNSLKYQVVRDFHNEKHFGSNNTCNDIKKYYYWPNMSKYVSEYCASCDTCLRTKNPSTRPKAALKPMDWAEYHPRQAIALDLATMAPSTEGYRYVMLIVDGMSKWVELCPLRNISAQSVINNVKRE